MYHYAYDLFAIQLDCGDDDSAVPVNVEPSLSVGRQPVDDPVKRRLVGIHGRHRTDLQPWRPVLRNLELVLVDGEDRRVVVEVGDDETKGRRTAQRDWTSAIRHRHHVVDGQKNIGRFIVERHEREYGAVHL